MLNTIMRYLFALVFIFIQIVGACQINDSISIIHQLDTFSLSTEQSTHEYGIFLKREANALHPKTRLPYYEKGLAFCNKMGYDSSGFLYAYNMTVLYAFELEDYEGAFRSADKGVDIAKRLVFPKTQGDAYNLLGVLHLNNAEFVEALDAFFLALDAYQNANASSYITYPLTNISTIFYDFGDIPSALKYTRAAINWCDKLESPDKEASKVNIYIRMKDFHLESNEIDSARYFLELALENNTELDTLNSRFYQDRKMIAHFSAATFYIEQKEFAAAMTHLDAAKKIGLNPDLLEVAFLDYYLATNDLIAAKQYYELVKDYEIMPVYLEYFLTLKSQYYERTNNFSQALLVKEELIAFREERALQHRLNYSKYVNTKLTNYEKEKKVQVLEKDKSITLYKNKQLSWVLAFTLGLLVLTFFLLRQIKEKNRLLVEDLANKQLIEKQAAALRKNNDLKDQLLSNISHELRTPLTLINGPIEMLLQKEKLLNTDRKQLQLVKRNSDELLQLTNQILDLTKSEFGAIKVVLSSFYFHDLLNFLYPLFQNQADKKGVTLKYPKDIPTGIRLHSDAEKLMTILKNLLMNAIKYSSNKQKEVTVSYKVLEKDLIVEVEDRGQGITEKDLPYIFDRYYQSNMNKTLDGGVGIGLAICKEYIQLLGGSISVESQFNIGSRFSIQFPKVLQKLVGQVQQYDFPLTESYEQAPSTNSNVLDDVSNEPHILIVEDNSDLCEFLEQILGGQYHLSFASNGQKALEQIAIKPPALIITDWMMPEMDGYQLLQQLKSSELMSQIPVIMLTARDGINDKLKVLQTGIDDYLTKPFIKEELTVRVENLLKNSTARKEYLEMLANGHLAVADPKELMPNAGLSEESKLWIEELEVVVKNNISNTNLTVEMVATQLFISRPQFFRRVKALTGITPMNYIQEVRYEEARRMLEQRKFLTVKAVANAVGFKSAKTFSSNFKKRFGRLPSDYLAFK